LPERDPRKEATVLARKAQGDATAMRKFADDPEIADDIIGFHAEQAVEKWLKAVIGSRGSSFEYTHDLRHLIELVRSAVGDFPFEVGAVIGLTEYAVPLRYDELLDAEPLDRDATVSLVDEVGRWASAQIESCAGEAQPESTPPRPD
jgi:HEPN domain-containing protein